MLKNFLLTATALATAAFLAGRAGAHADQISDPHGGWTSGGGQVLKDSHNPWFLHNVSNVNYCIELDEENFGATRATVGRRVRQVIDFWGVQLRNAPTYNPNSPFKLGLQRFHEVPCSNTAVDLRFQFGVLDGNQLAYLKNPRGFVAVSVRTHYDPVNLRGKGFIYVSPERGPLALELPQRLSTPWRDRDGSLLLPTLIHEMGHVWGLVHGSINPLMSETVLEKLLREGRPGWTPANFWADLERDGVLTNEIMFRPSRVESGAACRSEHPVPITPAPRPTHAPAALAPAPSDHHAFWRFFGVPTSPSGSCGYSVKFEDGVLLVNAKIDDGREQLIGSARDLDQYNPWDLTDAISVYLPPEQILFPKHELRGTIAYFQQKVVYKGTYRTIDGKIARELTITHNLMESMNLAGILDGKLYFDLQQGY